LCVTSLPTPPANDNCAGAVNIASGAACTLTAGTTAGATQSLAGCVGTANDDVWYSFTPTTTGQSITINASAGFDPVVQIFSGDVLPYLQLDVMMHMFLEEMVVKILLG
jgi:hypothetical protein